MRRRWRRRGSRLCRPARPARPRQVIARLVAVPGIGRWTAEIYAMFSLGRADVFAPGDLALQEAARLLFDLPARPTRRRPARDGRRPGRPGGRLRRGCSGPTTGWPRNGKGSDDTGIWTPSGASRLSGETTLGGGVPAWLRRQWRRPAGAGRSAGRAPARHAVRRARRARALRRRPDGLSVVPDPLDRRIERGRGRCRAWNARRVDLDAFLDGVLVDEDLLPEQVVLFGLLARHDDGAACRAPARGRRWPAIVAFSGRLLEPELLADEAVSRPPVLLIHGDQDEVVPPQSLPEAGEGAAGRGLTRSMPMS